MVTGMLECEKHTMENDAWQGWPSKFHHHTQELQAGIILIGFFFFTHKAIKIERTKPWDMFLRCFFNTSGISLPIPNYFKLLWSELLADHEANEQGQNQHNIQEEKGYFCLKNTQKSCLETHFVLIYSSNFCQRPKTATSPSPAWGRPPSFHFKGAGK